MTRMTTTYRPTETDTDHAASWPPATTVVMVSWAVARMPGRVLRAAGDCLAMAMALPRGSAALPQPGGPVMVEWSDADGLHERPATLDAYKAGLLHLVGAGPTTTTQRRRFFRAPVTIDLTISDGTTKFRGTTLDLSEGGTRAAVRAVALLPSTPVTATMHLGEESVDVPSTVVRHVARGPKAEIGLAFGDLPRAAADMIRRQVFSAQVEARKNGQNQ